MKNEEKRFRTFSFSILHFSFSFLIRIAPSAISA